MLASLGCHAYQGYLYSRPMDIQAFEDGLTLAAAAAAN
jgi:EAL domain-containing protein (putative c-di-GMP-specific phosphodiesterase class I)